MAIVEAHDLRKIYRTREAVRGISLQVGAGEFAAIIGPNGAGKTTFIEMLEGQRPPSSGTASIFGLDPHHKSDFARIRPRMGVVLQRNTFEPTLSLKDALSRQASFYNRRYSTRSLVGSLDLEAHLGTSMGKLSEGTKRRADLAVALIGRPELLILDEPTAGLDPSARQGVHALLTQLLADGVTILMTSHHLDEVERLASTLHVLRDGRIVRAGTPASLVREASIQGVIEFDLPPIRPEFLPAGANLSGNRVRYNAEHAEETLRDLQNWASERHLQLAHLSVTRPSLNDAYEALLKNEAPE